MTRVPRWFSTLVALGLALLVYAPSLDGPFVSDDLHYVEYNTYLHDLTFANLGEILSPWGAPARNVVNWSPVQLLLHAAVWQLAGNETLAHHLLNLLLHVAASLLLVGFFRRVGVPELPALFGAAAFLLHPANVEAVAWISQLKSSSALVLALLAIAALPRRPGLAAALYLLALLAKPTAIVALPIGIWLLAAERRAQPWAWHAIAAIGTLAFSAVELGVHQRSGAAEALLHQDPALLLRSILALLARYAGMALTGFGCSAFHEPEPARSWLDPRWLASLGLVAAIAWRCVRVFEQRGLAAPELACWAWAAISFGPVSQIFPFLYPMADRYLYFILPGLIGALLLAGCELARSLALHTVEVQRWRAVALGAAALLLVSFGARANARARIWSSPVLLMADAAANYPDGVSAQLQRGKAAAQHGDPEGALREIRAAIERGFDRYEQLDEDPAWRPIARDARFRALVSELAGKRIRWFEARGDLTQLEWRGLASAYVARREYREALAALERALEVGGAQDDQVRREIEGLRPHARSSSRSLEPRGAKRPYQESPSENAR
jgi:tetratricopeptide (TPR) repeat protein